MSPTRTLARQIRELRKRHGWSAAQLAEEMTKAGVNWDRYTVANLERGRRQTLTLDEAIALAYALGIAPVDLLVPKDLTDEPYQVTPTIAAPARTVREWITGQRFLSDPQSWAELTEAIRFMPEERAEAMASRWLARRANDRGEPPELLPVQGGPS